MARAETTKQDDVVTLQMLDQSLQAFKVTYDKLYHCKATRCIRLRKTDRVNVVSASEDGRYRPKTPSAAGDSNVGGLHDAWAVALGEAGWSSYCRNVAKDPDKDNGGTL